VNRLLLLRSAGSESDLGPDVDVVTTHEVVPIPAALDEVARYDAAGAHLVVTSQETARLIGDVRRFRHVHAAGEATARALKVRAPEAPGAAGILAALPDDLTGERFLWPHAADADPLLEEALAARGAAVEAPVVYEKVPRPLPEPLLHRFREGAYAAVAVASLSALDAFLAALGPAPRPPVRWGVIGPESAKAFRERGLPEPLVPARARLADLISLLRS